MKDGFLATKVASFYPEIKKLCKPDMYNLVLHKHLGDVFYAIGLKKEFEKTYNAKLHFIVRPQHEFLMKMYGIETYSVYDMKRMETDAINYDFVYLPYYANNITHKFDTLCKDIFVSSPIKSEPFILDRDIMHFLMFDHYWCFLWGYNAGLDFDNFKFEVPQNKIQMSETAKATLEKIAPINKIVLFAPEAATAIEFAPDFWNIIAEQVHKKGYTIIVNSKKYKINHGISAFDLNLSLQDVVALGLNCAYVFSLRSGLCDVLVGAGDRLYAFYPSQLRREYNSLNFPFVGENTGVHEVLVYDWQVTDVRWKDIDLTPELQKYVDVLHKSHLAEARKVIFSKRQSREGHRFWRNLLNDLAGVSRIFPENNIQNPKPSTSKVISLLGFNLYAHYRQGDYKDKKIYLGGLIYHTKYLKDGARITRFLGIPVYQRRYTSHRVVKIFGIPVSIKNLKSDFLQNIYQEVCKAVGNNFDDVFICRHNIGETLIYLAHLKDWVRHYKSKNPVIVAWRKRDFDFYKIFAENFADVVYVPFEQIHLNWWLTDTVSAWRGKRFICPTFEIAENMKKLSQKTGQDVNFYDFIVQEFSDTLTEPSLPVLNTEKVDSIKDKIQHIVNGKKFVLFAPEAISMEHMPEDFWEHLAIKFMEKGYAVVINSFDPDFNIDGTIKIRPDLEEIYVWATCAKGVVSIASGLSVWLSVGAKRADLIYSDFKNKVLTSAEAIKYYSVKKIPLVKSKNVREYDQEIYTRKQLISNILKEY